MSRSTSTKRKHQAQPYKEPVMCPFVRKVSHSSRKKALTALNQLRGKRTGLPMSSLPTQVYRCPHCRDWHLTSQEAR